MFESRFEVSCRGSLGGLWSEVLRMDLDVLLLCVELKRVAMGSNYFFVQRMKRTAFNDCANYL